MITVSPMLENLHDFNIWGVFYPSDFSTKIVAIILIIISSLVNTGIKSVRLSDILLWLVYLVAIIVIFSC